MKILFTILLLFASQTIASNEAVDITNKIFTTKAINCIDYINQYQSTALDVNNNREFNGSLIISADSTSCYFKSNGIPNHNFDDGVKAFPNTTSIQDDTYIVTQTPKAAQNVTKLSLTMDNAIMLNGVKVDMLAAACYGVGPNPLGQEKIGCHDSNQPFRYDPMYVNSNFIVDSHHAHTQPTGAYHYHGNPMAMFDTANPIESPVIGFAADGFPIYGSYFNDNGVIRKAKSSYVLKNNGGKRQDITYAGKNYSPGGNYDGKFIDDYIYDTNSGGDLDECNGMIVNGSYGYYVTDTFPWIIHCFKGTPNKSFSKRPPEQNPHHNLDRRPPDNRPPKGLMRKPPEHRTLPRPY